jgi:membrane-bound serine protease (ClpP class)
MDVQSHILTALANPTVAYVVFLTGGVLIVVECVWPRYGLAGISGAVLVTLALNALAQFRFTTQGTVLLMLSVAITLSSLRGTSYVAPLSSGVTFGLGCALLLNSGAKIHPAAAAVGGIFAIVYHSLLRTAWRGRIAKLTNS